MPLTQLVAPTSQPLTLEEVKAHCRVDHTADDTLLTLYLKMATAAAQTLTNRSVMPQTWRLTLDAFPGAGCAAPAVGRSFGLPPHAVLLENPPVTAVSSVKYLDMAGTLQTLSASEYTVDLSSEPARLTPKFGYIWPVTLPQIGAVQVDYTAGYANAAAVPDELKAWILLRIGSLYANREDASDRSLVTVPFAPEILAPLKVTIF